MRRQRTWKNSSICSLTIIRMKRLRIAGVSRLTMDCEAASGKNFTSSSPFPFILPFHPSRFIRLPNLAGVDFQGREKTIAVAAGVDAFQIAQVENPAVALGGMADDGDLSRIMRAGRSRPQFSPEQQAGVQNINYIIFPQIHSGYMFLKLTQVCNLFRF